MEGFTIGGMLVIDKSQLAAVSAFANDTLYPETRDAATAANWHFIDSHRGVFQRHGVCAQKRPASGVTAIENMALPYYQAVPVPKWFGFEPFSADRETNFNAARDTRPYASRQRWFRTMADICLFVQYRQQGSPPVPGKWGLADVIEACLGGPFHPTAEGHAHIADAVYAKAKDILGLPTPSIEILRQSR